MKELMNWATVGGEVAENDNMKTGNSGKGLVGVHE